MVALFEIAYQYAIAGAGVAGAAALLYTAPVMVAVLARVVLKEALTPTRVALAFLVMAGVALTVTGGSNAGAEAARMGLTAGIAGGLLSALSYALTSLMGRWAAPRYGVAKVLFLEAIGGVPDVPLRLYRRRSRCGCGRAVHRPLQLDHVPGDLHPDARALDR